MFGACGYGLIFRVGLRAGTLRQGTSEDSAGCGNWANGKRDIMLFAEELLSGVFAVVLNGFLGKPSRALGGKRPKFIPRTLLWQSHVLLSSIRFTRHWPVSFPQCGPWILWPVNFLVRQPFSRRTDEHTFENRWPSLCSRSMKHRKRPARRDTGPEVRPGSNRT